MLEPSYRQFETQVGTKMEKSQWPKQVLLKNLLFFGLGVSRSGYRYVKYVYRGIHLYNPFWVLLRDGLVPCP